MTIEEMVAEAKEALAFATRRNERARVSNEVLHALVTFTELHLNAAKAMREEMAERQRIRIPD
jgi:hypothetical protein